MQCLRRLSLRGDLLRSRVGNAGGAIFYPENRSNIPSEQQATTEGVAIGEMQKILLRKIEELTLHMITLGKENAALKQTLQSLQQQLTERK